MSDKRIEERKVADFAENTCSRLENFDLTLMNLRKSNKINNEAFQEYVQYLESEMIRLKAMLESVIQYLEKKPSLSFSHFKTISQMTPHGIEIAKKLLKKQSQSQTQLEQLGSYHRQLIHQIDFLRRSWTYLH